MLLTLLLSCAQKQETEVKQANNAFVLYDQYGQEWKNVDASEIKGEKNLDWSGMPVEAINYLKSLPEWNEDNFKWGTGLDVAKRETIKIGEHEYDKAEVEKRLEGLK